MTRKYDTDVKKAASVIAAEVVEVGTSSGWVASDFKAFNQLKGYLANFNIAYVDDFAGEWRYKKTS
jgi:hypothetical protein